VEQHATRENKPGMETHTGGIPQTNPFTPDRRKMVIPPRECGRHDGKSGFTEVRSFFNATQTTKQIRQI
jgi:hypothetical protein